MTVGHGYAVPNTWWYPGKPTRRINALKGSDGLLLHSVRELHQKARIANTLWDSSPLSDPMESLEIIAKQRATSDYRTRFHVGVPLYLVTAADINNV